jgi:hypothetical protein
VPTWARKHVIGLATFGPRDQFPRRVKMRMCMDCNGRLGRDFERHASELLKPMLDGSEVTLSRRDQSHIARWVVKTSLLMNISGLRTEDPDRSRAIAVVRSLMAEFIPPRQTLIRIFRRNINEEDSLIEKVSAVRVKAPPTAFFSISSVGYLAWEMAIGPNGPILEYQSETAGRAGFSRIWPPQGNAVQWPTYTVSTAEIEELRAAYLEAAKPGVSPPVVRQWDAPEKASAGAARFGRAVAGRYEACGPWSTDGTCP